MKIRRVCKDALSLVDALELFKMPRSCDAYEKHRIGIITVCTAHVALRIRFTCKEDGGGDCHPFVTTRIM